MWAPTRWPPDSCPGRKTLETPLTPGLCDHYINFRPALYQPGPPKEPKIMAEYPKRAQNNGPISRNTEGIGSIGSTILAILEIQEPQKPFLRSPRRNPFNRAPKFAARGLRDAIDTRPSHQLRGHASKSLRAGAARGSRASWEAASGG